MPYLAKRGRPYLVRQLVEAKQLDQNNEDPHAEIQIASGLSAQGGGDRDAPRAKREHKGAFALHDEIRDATMTRRDRQAK